MPLMFVVDGELRNVAQPCERGGVEFDVVHEKPVEATELLGRQRRDKGIGRAPSSLGTPGQTEPFDCVRGGQDELGGAQPFQDPTRDRLALVGRPRGRGSEIEGDRHVGADEGT